MTVQGQECLRQFDAGLAKLRIEVLKNLDSIDVLDADAVTGLVERLNQRLIVAQHDFLDFLHRALGSTSGAVETFELTPANTTVGPEIGSAVTGAGATAVLVNVVAWTVPAGWFTAASTTTLATSIGAIVGIGATTVTLGAAAVGALAFGVPTYMWRLAERKKQVRMSVLKSFDEEALPKLRNWAQSLINQALTTRRG